MSKDSNLQPYGDNLEHLRDCLQWLDGLIRLHLLRQKARRPINPLEGFKGLVISEEEVAHLLTGEPRDAGDSKDSDAAIGDLSEFANQIRNRCVASRAQDIPLALPELAEIFGLNGFETNCLIVALAPEISRKYEKLYGFLHDDVTRKKPTVDLVLTLLCPTLNKKIENRAAFEPQRALMRYRLTELIDDAQDSRSPLISRTLKLDDRIVNHLVGPPRLDVRLDPITKLINADAEWGDLAIDGAIQQRIRDFIAWHVSEPDAENIVFHFHGPTGCGANYLAECVCRELGLPLLLGDAAKILAKSTPAQELLWLLGREAALQPALLGVENIDMLLAAGGQGTLDSVLGTASTFSRVSFLIGQNPIKGCIRPGSCLFIDVPLSYPDVGARRRLWESRLADETPIVADVDPGALASKFRLTPGGISDCIAGASNHARWRSPGNADISMEDLQRACRQQSGAALGSLARKIEPGYDWDDIVLPDEALAQLHEMCDRVSLRHRVLSEWGFARKLSLGRGVNALFAGPSGTGKTMAAEIIANELSLDLYKIDLSGMVSKYIGETEKNLNAVFTAAECSNAILFFDEADAIFGKRSEVRDSHDRYANLEISYLLQKMEEYEGVAILATNLRQNLDESFLRRLAFIVHFPFPDEADRLRIWRGAWPAQTPLAPELNFDSLARQFKLSGGNIRNVALAAAYLAASDGGTVTMDRLHHATRREFQKMGKVLNEKERLANNAQPVLARK